MVCKTGAVEQFGQPCPEVIINALGFFEVGECRYFLHEANQRAGYAGAAIDGSTRTGHVAGHVGQPPDCSEGGFLLQVLSEILPVRSGTGTTRRSPPVLVPRDKTVK